MRDELKEKIKCDECGLPVEVCNICVFASMQSHCETEKERATIADEYRADIIAYTEKECRAARIDELDNHNTFVNFYNGQLFSGHPSNKITVDDRINQLKDTPNELKKGIK